MTPRPPRSTLFPYTTLFRSARTREASLQVELAQHEYLLPRLRGQWQHLERMEGAIGSRGPGETQIETDRRLIGQRISRDRKSTRLNSSHGYISYAVFCLKKK